MLCINSKFIHFAFYIIIFVHFWDNSMLMYKLYLLYPSQYTLHDLYKNHIHCEVYKFIMEKKLIKHPFYLTVIIYLIIDNIIPLK